MDLDKLNNIVSNKKSEEEEKKEKERLEELKREKEKKDSLDKIQSLINGDYYCKVIPVIRNIKDDELQEIIEKYINDNYEVDNYTINITINFDYIRIESGRVVDEDLIKEMMDYQNKELDCDWTYDQFLREVRYEPGALETYMFNYFEVKIPRVWIYNIDKKFRSLGLVTEDDTYIFGEDLGETSINEVKNEIKNKCKLIFEKTETDDFDCDILDQYFIGKLPNIQEIEEELKNRLEDFGFKIIDIKNDEVLDNDKEEYIYKYSIIIQNPTKN